MPTSDILAIEKLIAAAHRNLNFARDHASRLRDLSLHDDLQMIQLELERLQVDLLRGPRRRRPRVRNEGDCVYPGAADSLPF